MNILFDINVILDALLDRKPFGREAIQLISAAEESIINGFLCADSLTTIFYLMQKSKDQKAASEYIRLLLEIFDIAPVNRAVLEDALTLSFKDFEDAVIHQSALSINADGIVTRNPKDYKKSKIAIYSPRELLAAINQK